MTNVMLIIKICKEKRPVCAYHTNRAPGACKFAYYSCKIFLHFVLDALELQRQIMLVLHRGLHQSFGQQQCLIIIAEARCRYRLLHHVRKRLHAVPALAGRVLPEDAAGLVRVGHAPQRGHAVRVREQHGLIIRIGGQLAQNCHASVMFAERLLIPASTVLSSELLPPAGPCGMGMQSHEKSE